MVREGSQHQLRLHSIEYWSVLRQDTLDPMGDIAIGVGQVADDLQHGPSPGDGPRDQLLAANAGNGRPEYPGAGEIGVEQGGLFHLGLPPAGLGLLCVACRLSRFVLRWSPGPRKTCIYMCRSRKNREGLT